MKVLIAGSNGLVGSALVRSKPEIYSLIAPSRPEVNFEDFASVASFVEVHNPDAIILAAAKVGGIEANRNAQFDFLMANLRIQNAFFEAALKFQIKNFIFLGSSCIYPKLAKQPLKESSLMTGELEPTNEGYAIAKIAGIKACRSIHEELGYNYISLMPCNLYGPNDNFDLVNSHVPAALMRKIHEAKIHNKKSVEVWGTGKAKREFMHVDDLANAVWYFLGRSDCAGELINIGSGKDMSILRFAELVRLTVGYKGDLKFNADMPEGTPRKVLNVDKARNFGWESRIEIESGIRSFYEWFKNSYGKGEVRGI